MGERLIETDLLADRAYSSRVFRFLAEVLGFNLVTPPKSNTKEAWEYDKEKYKQRNKIERLFGRIKTRFRRIFVRYDKLAIVYMGFVYFALAMELLRFNVNTP